MGKSKPVGFTFHTFARKGDAGSFFKQILNRYSPGQRVDPTDELILRELFTWHPEIVEKSGGRIGHIEVRHGPYYPADKTQCFWLVCDGRDPIDISYIEALKGAANSQNP
jgi:hypothetical protein